ncbi:MAG: hypothetical protein J3K34DRAFT_424365 [Monoraphidium minutum]|nr:MAG: hypothetical protein J3K34DRAFT_424365 [Monoraphidium minutum]
MRRAQPRTRLRARAAAAAAHLLAPPPPLACSRSLARAAAEKVADAREQAARAALAPERLAGAGAAGVGLGLEVPICDLTRGEGAVDVGLRGGVHLGGHLHRLGGRRHRLLAERRTHDAPRTRRAPRAGDVDVRRGARWGAAGACPRPGASCEACELAGGRRAPGALASPL